MTIKRKKIGKNTYQTTNTTTGTTRVTHSIKTGASTRTSQSWNSKGNNRRTSTSNVGGVVTRKQTSSSPKNYKSTSSRSRSSRSTKQSKLENTIVMWIVIFLCIGYAVNWVIEFFTAYPGYLVVLGVIIFSIIVFWLSKK